MTPIREIAAPSPEAFQQTIVSAGEPVVMRGLVSDWPWVGKDRGELLDEIRKASLNKRVMTFHAGSETRGRYFYSDDLSGFNFERRQESLAALIDWLESGMPGHAYAGGVNIPEHLPAFLDSHPTPLLPEDTDRLTSLWIGNRGRVPAHYDLPDNIAAVLHGSRTFTLFAPEQRDNLYIGPIDRTLAGQPCSLVDIEDPDFERFPRARAAMQSAMTATLEPGDAIFIPSLWFHAVKSETDLGVLVNIWWREGPDWAFTPRFTLLHALLSLRALPAHERQRWKGVFDHYIFDADDTTLEHIPEAVRGVLSELTPETAEQLRQYLGRHLLRK